MYPVIVQLGHLTIYSYGLMLAVAVIVCTFLLSRDARRKGISPEMVFDLAFWTVLAGIVGARLFYIILNWEFFRQNIFEMVMIQKGGLAWQGGLIFGGLAGVGFVKRRKLPLLEMLDLAAPYIALGQSIGRIGCFLNGCCYGKEVSWGIFFLVHHAHLHPTQLYSALGLFVIFVILRYYPKFCSPSQSGAGKGSVFLLYLVLASAERFGVEFFRGDHQELFLGLSIYQWVCLGFAALAVRGYFLLRKG